MDNLVSQKVIESIKELITQNPENTNHYFRLANTYAMFEDYDIVNTKCACGIIKSIDFDFFLFQKLF